MGDGGWTFLDPNGEVIQTKPTQPPMYPNSTRSFTLAVVAAFLTVHMVYAAPYATKTPHSLNSNRTVHPAGLASCSTTQS